MLRRHWRETEFEAVEELRTELRDLLSMLGHVDAEGIVPKRSQRSKPEETEPLGFML